MSNQYGLYSSLPYTPTLPPSTAVPHHYHPHPLPYSPWRHHQLPVPIPCQTIVTLATATSTHRHYHLPPTPLMPHPPPTPLAPSVTHPPLPQPPAAVPPPLTPTHQDAWEAKMAAQHSELMHLLRLQMGLPTTPPPPQPTPPLSSPPPPAALPSPTLPPTPVLTPSMPSPLTLPTPTIPPTTTITAVGLLPHTSAPLHGHDSIAPMASQPITPSPPPHFLPPTMQFLQSQSMSFPFFSVMAHVSHRPDVLAPCYAHACTGSYATSPFEAGLSGHRIWNPGVPTHMRLTLFVPHLEDKVNFSGAGNDMNRILRVIKNRGVYESLVNSRYGPWAFLFN